MKKIFTLMAVAVLALGASAQQFMSADLRQQLINPNQARYNKVAPKLVDRRAELIAMPRQQVGVASKKAAATTGSADTAFYFPNYKVLKGGWDGDGYSMAPMFIQRYQDTVKFWNNSIFNTGAEFAWAFSDSLTYMISQDTDLVFPANQLFTQSDLYIQDKMPAIVMENGNTYYYGNAFIDLYSKYGYTGHTYWMSQPTSYYYPMTNCMMYSSEDANGTYLENNVDGWQWTYQNGGQYIFGSNWDPTQTAYATKFAQYGYTKRPDSLVVFFGYDKQDMYIDTVSLQFHSFTTDFLPAGSGVTVKLYDETGLIGSYTATAADTIGTYSYDYSSSYGFIWTHGQLNFPIKCTAHGQVEALITGYNDNGANIGFKADMDNYSGTTYHVINGKLKYYWIANLAMTFNAKFGADHTALDDVEAPAAKVQKVIENGKLFILKNGVRYNAAGQIVK